MTKIPKGVRSLQCFYKYGPTSVECTIDILDTTRDISMDELIGIGSEALLDAKIRQELADFWQNSKKNSFPYLPFSGLLFFNHVASQRSTTGWIIGVFKDNII